MRTIAQSISRTLIVLCDLQLGQRSESRGKTLQLIVFTPHFLQLCQLPNLPRQLQNTAFRPPLSAALNGYHSGKLDTGSRNLPSPLSLHFALCCSHSMLAMCALTCFILLRQLQCEKTPRAVDCQRPRGLSAQSADRFQEAAAAAGYFAGPASAAT